MPKMLTESELSRYQQDGVLFPVPIMPAEEIALSLARSNELEEYLGGKPKSTVLAQSHLHFRWAYDLATHPQLLDAVEDVLGPDLVIWSTSIFAKHARNPSYISWHQDGTYWGLDSQKVTTAWIALSDSTVENGCMRVVAGSQRQEIQPHVDTYADRNLLSRGQEIAVEVQEEQATDVVLKAGEMSLHHVNIIHGSNANGSDGKRVGFAIRFIAPEVRQAGQRPQAILARGRGDDNHFEFVGRPPDRSFEEAAETMKAATRKFIESIVPQERS
jgi:non-heme Fe2+,alpha-ketoglutarate-dependent halogenase